MSIRTTWKSIRLKIKKWVRSKSNSSESPPLREFIYLDEVSLRSLLASQTGAVTEQILSAISQAENSELASSVSAGNVVAKGEIKSRYQTSNSRSTQTSRKAIVQSWFKELRELPGINFLIESGMNKKEFQNLDEVLHPKDEHIAIPSNRIKRGELIEIEIELAVDPVFKMSMMISEFLDMAKDFPGMLTATDSAANLSEVGPVNKILQYLLAGLIPIRAKAVNYSVIRVKEEDIIVHNDTITNLDVVSHDLEIVGITEHLCYWKDIRRVLFSDARFTILCRVARNGIQKTWTPVKLADLFNEVVPNFTQQISEAGDIGLMSSATGKQNRQCEAFRQALKYYYESRLEKEANILTSEIFDLHGFIEKRKQLADTVSDQNRVFEELEKKLVKEMKAKKIDANDRLKLRQEARLNAGLELLPKSGPTDSTKPQNLKNTDHYLVDTEIIAIYW